MNSSLVYEKFAPLPGALHLFVLLCILPFFLLTACDLLNGKPEKDITKEIEYAVWLANQPYADLRMEIIEGSGTTNPPVGDVSPQPKQEVPFRVYFSANPDYGFVEWRAYWADEPEKNEEAALGTSHVLFSSRDRPETEVRILVHDRKISIIPFCVERPRVSYSSPPMSGSVTRVPTNFPIEIWFTGPVDEASVSFDTIKISGVSKQGAGQSADDLHGHFKPPVLDASGTFLRLEAGSNGLPSNYNISVVLGPGICHRDYPGVAMSKSETLNYGVSDSADTTPPVVENVKGALQNTEGGDFFTDPFAADSPDYRLQEEDGDWVVYLFFDAYKPNGTVRDVRIVEGANLSRDYEAGRDSESPLASKYQGEYGFPPFTVRHIVQSREDGVISFFILPGDAMGNRTSIEEAMLRGAYVQAVLDMPPQPVSNLQAFYHNNSLEISWTNPPDSDLKDIELELLKNGVPIPGKSGPIGKEGTKIVSEIYPDNSEYTVTLRAVDNNEESSPVSVKVIANAAILRPVSELRGKYKDGTRLELSWSYPPDLDPKEFHVEWGKTGQSTSSVPVNKEAQLYEILNIPEDGSEYTISVRAVNNYNVESAPVSISIIADSTPPGELTNLAAVYNPGFGAIHVSWKDPADADFNRVYLEVYRDENEPPLTTGTVPKGQEGYTINGIAGDSEEEYTIKLWTADKAGNQRPNPQTVTVDVDGVPPASVGNLTGAYEPAAQRITLSWDNPSDSDLKELRIQWGKIGQTQSSATVTKDKETYNISGIPGDMSLYPVSVRAVDASGNVSSAETVYIEADGIPPGQVSNLSAVYDQENQKITVTWSDPSATDLKEIHLEWGVTGQAVTPVTIAKGVGSYPIENIEDGKQYTIRLRSVDNTGNASAAAVRTVLALLPPPPPDGINAANTLNSGELAVSWNAVTGASSCEVWYNTVDNRDSASHVDASGTTRTLTGLTNGTAYYIWLRAKNAAGPGNFSGPVTGTPKNNVAALSGITVNSQSVSGFNPTKLTGYTALAAPDSGNVTVAGTPAAGSGGTVSYSPAQPMALEPGASRLVTITVTAENGTTQKAYTITVTKQKNFSLIIGPEEENITVEYTGDYGDPPVVSYTGAEELVFTVSGEYQAVKWFVGDSEEGSGASFTVRARDYLPASGGKPYTLTVMVTKGGLVYSKDVSFKVSP